MLKDHFENNLESKGVTLLRFGFHETLNADDYWAILLPQKFSFQLNLSEEY